MRGALRGLIVISLWGCSSAPDDAEGVGGSSGSPGDGGPGAGGSSGLGGSGGSAGLGSSGGSGGFGAFGSGGAGATAGSGGGEPDGGSCLAATAACSDGSQCCDGLDCGTTTLGQVCCGNEGASCATANGEDCCGDLWCVNGTCGYEIDPGTCESPCKQPPALVLEKERLATIGGTFLGICGDAGHTYGYHVAAALLPSSDYSMQGAANVPACIWHAAAIDIGMDWPASRDWLRWLIAAIATDEIKGIAEVIGSYDGYDVRYWSDSSGWATYGVPYTGSGHDTHTHVAIYRSTTLDDHGILAGW